MKTKNLLLIAAAAAQNLAAHAQPLQPEVLYNFQLGPRYDCRLVESRDGSFYGTSSGGGRYDRGTFFRLSTDDILTTLLCFDGTNGAAPRGALALGEDGNIYGTTTGGGAYGKGTVFRVTPNGALTTLVSFNGPDCCGDPGGLILGRDGNFYGTTRGGGTNNLGAAFRVTPSGLLTTLASFNGTNGLWPNQLVLANDGNFYGTTYEGGRKYMDSNRSDLGTVFKLTPNGELTPLAFFNGTNGAYPNGLVFGNDGNFYGTTESGGSNWLSQDPEIQSFGTMYRVTTNGVFTMLISFNGTNGASPNGLVLGNDGNLYGATRYGGSNGAGTMFKISADGKLTTLAAFSDADHPGEGDVGWNAMVLGKDGNFYGTTGFCCPDYPLATVFQLTTNGVFTTLVSFSETSAVDVSALVLGNDGNFYGTTKHGGGRDSGSMFEFSTNGVFNTLVTFSGTNGVGRPYGLVLGNDGRFYGTTYYYGPDVSGLYQRYGTLFQVSPDWKLTTLYSFTNSTPSLMVRTENGDFYGVMQLITHGYPPPNDYSLFKLSSGGMLNTLISWTNAGFNSVPNSYPLPNSLVFGADGRLYGPGPGGILAITTHGEVSTLTPFNGTNGSGPNALVLGNDGNFYGTTSDGGSTYLNQTNSGFGTVFKLATNGALTTLASFNGTNGAWPGELVLGDDGSFYGTAAAPLATSSDGMVFRVTPDGVLTTLALFNDSTGSGPQNLVWGRDGNLYGTTDYGGSGGGGTFFRLVMPRFKAVIRQPGGSMLVSGTGPANGAFRLWTSPEVSMPFASWTLLTSSSFDRTGNFSFTDASAPTNKSRFYQLSVP